MFGRATIRLGIGPHSSVFIDWCNVLETRLAHSARDILLQRASKRAHSRHRADDRHC